MAETRRFKEKVQPILREMAAVATSAAWGDIVGVHPDVARNLRRRFREEGPLRSADMEGRGSRGWWDLKIAKRVATALWSSGELAIRERKHFQRTYDLAERVIPDDVRGRPLAKPDGIEALSYASQANSFLLLDSGGAPLTPLILWTDQRKAVNLLSGEQQGVHTF